MVFGLNQVETLRIFAHTFQDGDPSFAGALGGIALGLPSYHILELKAHIPAEVWEEQMAMHELEIEETLWEEIHQVMKAARKEE